MHNFFNKSRSSANTNKTEFTAEVLLMEFFINIGDVFLRALVSIAVLFVLTKLMGAKQISQLTFFDYAIGISIGSIAAELAASDEAEYLDTLLAMVIYSTVAVAISYATNKSIKARRFFTGTSTLLIDNGKLIRANLKKAKFDINDLLSEARYSGYFNISDIQFAILETNGHISFLPKSDKRPIMPQDLGMKPKQEGLCANVIFDGKVMEENLKGAGKNREWLDKQLEAQHVKRVEEVFLAICDESNQLTIFLKGEDAPKNSLLD